MAPIGALADRTEKPGSWKILMTAHVDQFQFDPSESFKQFISNFPALIAKRRGVELRDPIPASD